MSFIRVFGALTPSKEVVGVDLTVVSTSSAKVTDLQLQGGSSLFSWSPQVGDLGLVAEETWDFINGYVLDDYDTVLMTDADVASPFYALITPMSPQTMTWGLMQLGQVQSPQTINGFSHTATQGAGITPHLTRRADQRLDLVTDGISNVVIGVKGVRVRPPDPDIVDLGPVVDAHPASWAQVWGWHLDWSSVTSEHQEWS